MLQVKCALLEGPDLSGKSTLYNNIHRTTGFRWNIQDRGQLSMLCYARQFGRGSIAVNRWRSELDSFLLDLNNRLIVLLPDFSVIENRFSVRGDEIQNLESLKSLRILFQEEVDRLGDRPNLLVLREPLSTKDMTEACVKWLQASEELDPIGVSREVLQLAAASSGQEAVGCRFRFSPTSELLLSDDISALRYPPEEAYYARILSGVLQNIEDEVRGRNEYGTSQSPGATRRFIYTQSSCISLVHTVLRGDSLLMRVYCRSSNARDTFPHDFRFICYLYSRVYAHLSSLCGWSHPHRGNFVIEVEMGSAHIP
jgi:hypothetical protein